MTKFLNSIQMPYPWIALNNNNSVVDASEPQIMLEHWREMPCSSETSVNSFDSIKYNKAKKEISFERTDPHYADNIALTFSTSNLHG